MSQYWFYIILGDPAAVSGGGEKSKQARKKFGRRKVKNEKKRLDFSFLTFFRPNYFLARLDDWVSEDGFISDWMKT